MAINVPLFREKRHEIEYLISINNFKNTFSVVEGSEREILNRRIAVIIKIYIPTSLLHNNF